MGLTKCYIIIAFVVGIVACWITSTLNISPLPRLLIILLSNIGGFYVSFLVGTLVAFFRYLRLQAMIKSTIMQMLSYGSDLASALTACSFSVTRLYELDLSSQTISHVSSKIAELAPRLEVENIAENAYAVG